MKILALTNLFPPHYIGGYELICFHVLRALRRRGHEISVLTSNHLVTEAHGLPEEPNVERTLRIHGFFGQPWLGLWRLAQLERHNNSILRDAIRRHQPDLVYVWNMGGLSKSMLLTLQRLGIPTVFYISDHWITRGLSSDVWLRWWNRTDATATQRFARAVYERCRFRQRWEACAPTNPARHIRFERISFCSRALRQLTANAGFNVGHAAVIYPPVDLTEFNEPPRPQNQPIRRLLFVGRLAPDKGVMTALRALALVADTFRGELNVYGRGDPEFVKELKQFVAENRLRVSFRFAGLDEMAEVYRRHDALIFPSEWQEPFALTPVEAMASGLPVIGTLNGGSAELFRHRVNSLTYPAGNAEALAKCMIELVQQPDRRFHIASAGFEEVRRRFAEPVIVDQIEEYLQESLPVSASRVRSESFQETVL